MEQETKAGFYEELFLTYILMIYVTGVLLYFINYTSMGLRGQVVLFGILAVSVLLSFSLAYLFPAFQKYIRIVPLGGFLFTCLLQGNGIWYGLMAMLNRWILRWNTYHEDGRSLLAAQSTDLYDQGAAALAVTFLVLFLLMTVREKAFGLVELLLTTILLIAGLVSGHLPWAAMSLVLAGNMGYTFGIHKQGLVVIKVVWLMIITGSMLSLCLFDGSNLETTKSFREAVKQTAEDIRYGKSTLPEGNLYRAHKMCSNSRKMLTVQTEEIKNIYLRGFESGRYENGTWVSMKKSDYGYEYNGMLQWLQNRKFYPSDQYITYEQNSQKKDRRNHITIENVGADRGYVYTTYATKSIKNTRYKHYRDTGYRGNSLRGAGKYRLTEMSSNLPGELLVAESWVKNPNTVAQKKYMKSESVYRKFVYDTYCTVDTSLAPLIRSRFYDNAKAKDMTGAYAITSHIREKLRENASYQEEPEAVPKDRDAIYWFLTQGREGNSALFASAAVQAYRAFGIPARYAEGYLLTSERLKEEKGKAVTLTGKDSHSWVEIYLDGLGWVDIDVTPGFYYEEYALMQMVQKPQGVQMTADLQERSRNNGGNSGGKPVKKKAVPEHRNYLQILLGIIVLVLTLDVAVITFLELRRAVRYMLWHRRLKKADSREKGNILYAKIFHQLERLGIEAGIGWKIREVEEQICSIVPTVYAGEFVVINGMLEKGIYSEKSLSEGEIRAMVEFVNKLTMDVKGEKGLVNFLKMRYL